ncbi:MAG: DMT family transporter [Terriglobia bacterium]
MLTPYLLLLVAVLCWSGNFIAGKFALREFPPFALVVLRIWLSAALLAAIYFTRPNRRRLTRADLTKFAELGLYSVALNQTGFTVGLNYTTVAHSSLIISLSPIFILLLARWQRLEALTARKLLGMGLAFFGVVVLTSEHGFGSASPTFLGDILTLAAAISFSLYTVVGKKVARTYDTLTMNTFAYLIGAVLVLPLAGWQLTDVPWSGVSWQAWLSLAYMAALGSVLAYLLYYYALSRLLASRVAAFAYLQPPLATLLGVLILSEALSPQLLAGAAAILGGLYLTQRPADSGLER